MLTEQEAKEKWCPQAIRPVVVSTGSTAAVGANRNQHVLPLGTFCVGSECMVWRWNDKTTVYYIGTNELGRSEFKHEQLSKEKWTGYCGLAGKP